MNVQERWDYIRRNTEIIERNMAQYEEEKKNRKLVKFLETKEEKCSTSTIRGIYQKIASFWTKN